MLSIALKQKAKNELHENPEHLEAHLESFRRWIKSLPHISFPDDRQLMLAFLRHAKYIHSKAQTRLDNFCTIRYSPTLGVPTWFDYPSLEDPFLKQYLEMCPVVGLGQTEEGVHMFLAQKCIWKLNTESHADLRRLSYMDSDRIMADDSVQICGRGMFIDMSGAQLSHILSQGGMKEAKIETRIWQECEPVRLKWLVYYNEPAWADAVFRMFEPWLNDKIKRRMLRIGNNLDMANEKIPGLKKIMPPEYGGENEPLERLMERHRNGFREFYSQPRALQSIRVDESKRPNTAQNLMRDYPDLEWMDMGTEGTYIEIPQD